jgi:N-acyl homoserine lactone hydrolase
MSRTWTITPMDLGSVRREKSFFTYMTDVGTQADLAVISFLLRTPGRTVLVDTGGPPPDRTMPGHFPYEQAEHQRLTSQLEAHEVDPRDVGLVIYTHLHWDHAYNVRDLPAAQFVTTRRELEFAKDPCPIQDWMYDAPSTGGRPDYLDVDFTLAEPDEQILDGLRVVPTPGHSPGHQSVVVDTEDGRVVLAGDLSPLQENWDRQIPAGMLHNLEDHFRSFALLKAIGGRVVASHDPQVLADGVLPAAKPRV